MASPLLLPRHRAEVVVPIALKLIGKAADNNLSLKLAGGVAIWIRCPDARGELAIDRQFSDIDFVGTSQQRPLIAKLFRDQGFREDVDVASTPGLHRSVFVAPLVKLRCDIFYDALAFCHTIDLRRRLDANEVTISLADLLLQKLQIVSLTSNDINDVFLMLCQHRITTREDDIDASYIAELCSRDWGLWKTVTDNLVLVRQAAQTVTKVPCSFTWIVSRCDELLSKIADYKKSIRWRIRGLIGTRLRWYETVEDLKR